MTIYTELKACCLDGEGWSWIKAYGAHKRVAWLTANVVYTSKHAYSFVYTSEHAYSFESFSTVMKDAFTILNNYSENHSGNQMVRKMLQKIKVQQFGNGCL
jgi:hypothetical protein